MQNNEAQVIIPEENIPNNYNLIDYDYYNYYNNQYYNNYPLYYYYYMQNYYYNNYIHNFNTEQTQYNISCTENNKKLLFNKGFANCNINTIENSGNNENGIFRYSIDKGIQELSKLISNDINIKNADITISDSKDNSINFKINITRE